MTRTPLSAPDQLKRFREHLGYSQRELADVFGVTRGAIAMWENGTREMPGVALALLERLEIEFHVVTSGKIDPMLDEKHLSAKFAEKVLSHSGYKEGESDPETAKKVRAALLEMTRKHLSSVPATRRVQVSLIEKAVAAVADIKGIPVKILQLAGFMDLGLSLETRGLLTSLQHSLSPMPVKQVRQVLSEEFGAPPEDVFAMWNPRPVATASIGQVHEAVLKTGERVAVKVQYPNVYRNIVLQSQPVRLMSFMVALLRQDYADMLRDFVQKLRRECDYRVEADQQEAFRKAYEKDPDILVPRVHREFSTARVLTSDFIEGRLFHDFAATATQEEKNRAGATIHRFQYQSTMRLGLLQADIHPGNYIFREGQVAFVDFGRVIPLDESTLKNTRDFYRAVHENDRERARVIMRDKGYVRDWERFNFDEYWSLLREQMKYELMEGAVKFDRDLVKNIFRLGNSFHGRANLTMSAEFFWPILTSVNLWNLLAELEAEYPWRLNALAAMGADPAV